METVEKILLYIGNLALFIIMTILFVPSFLIVTYIQPIWAKKMEGLFKL